LAWTLRRFKPKGHVHPGAKFLGQPEIVHLIETRAQFDDHPDTVFPPGGAFQRRDHRGESVHAVNGLLDGGDARVGGGRADEINVPLETLVGVVQEDVPVLEFLENRIPATREVIRNGWKGGQARSDSDFGWRGKRPRADHRPDK
jgi:hypothetical protein